LPYIIKPDSRELWALIYGASDVILDMEAIDKGTIGLKDQYAVWKAKSDRFMAEYARLGGMPVEESPYQSAAAKKKVIALRMAATKAMHPRGRPTMETIIRLGRS
jgi:hypothetical protein